MTTDALFWDNLAERYAKKPVPNLQSYERKLVITKAKLRPGDSVLDIGCGTGSLALELAPHVDQVHAVDFSEGMVAIGRRKAARSQITNVTFHAATLEQTSFEPGQFDVICAYNILHLVEDRPTTLKQIFEYLRPGGTFISSTVCLDNTWIPFRPLLAVMRWVGKAPYVDIFDTDTILADLRDTGFAEIETPDVGAKREVAFVVASKPV